MSNMTKKQFEEEIHFWTFRRDLASKITDCICELQEAQNAVAGYEDEVASVEKELPEHPLPRTHLERYLADLKERLAESKKQLSETQTAFDDFQRQAKGLFL